MYISCLHRKLLLRPGQLLIPSIIVTNFPDPFGDWVQHACTLQMMCILLSLLGLLSIMAEAALLIQMLLLTRINLFWLASFSKARVTSKHPR